MGRKNRPRTEKRVGSPPKETAYALKKRKRDEGVLPSFEFKGPQKRSEQPPAPQPNPATLTPASDPVRMRATVSDIRKVKVGYIFLSGPEDLSIHLATHVLHGQRVKIGDVLDCTVQRLVGKSSPTVTKVHEIVAAL